jgi:phage-related baseplate assembly protein
VLLKKVTFFFCYNKILKLPTYFFFPSYAPFYLSSTKMDDMYQYAASAVNSNNKDQQSTSVPEEEDVIIKAFNNMGWGKKWSSLVDTVKKQVSG